MEAIMMAERREGSIKQSDMSEEDEGGGRKRYEVIEKSKEGETGGGAVPSQQEKEGPSAQRT